MALPVSKALIACSVRVTVPPPAPSAVQVHVRSDVSAPAPTARPEAAITCWGVRYEHASLGGADTGGPAAAVKMAAGMTANPAFKRMSQPPLQLSLCTECRIDQPAAVEWD